MSIYSFIAGICAGTLGIGGGIVVVPMLLSMKIKPTIVTSTTGFTILFTSSMTLS